MFRYTLGVYTKIWSKKIAEKIVQTWCFCSFILGIDVLMFDFVYLWPLFNIRIVTYWCGNILKMRDDSFRDKHRFSFWKNLGT